MIRSLSLSQTGALGFLGAMLLFGVAAPAQVVPALTPEQKDAAAAIEAPRAFTAPPVPGQLQGGGPAPAAPASPLPMMPRPAAPAPVLAQPVADTPALPSSGSSLSKMQALEAVTQEPAVKLAPHVSAPADRMPITTSTSTSGQFIVHGKVFETRSAMSSRCEEISQELRKVLNDKEAYVLPIVVLLNTGDDALKSKGPAIATAITELSHGGFHLQVTVNDRPGLNAADLRKEVVRALLAERILRSHQKIATPESRLLLPDWVMTGVLHAMDYKASPRPSAIFSAIFRSGKIYGIEEIIAASPVEMDGLSRSIYETSCCALVLALVDQPDGPQRFNKFLSSLASDPRSERELLDAAFPRFTASASSLNKWWSLQLATLSKPGIAEPYTAADSLKAIEDAIVISYGAKPDEVPQNVKQHPFVLPPPLFVKPAAPKPPPIAHHTDAPPASRPAREREMAQTSPAAGPPASSPPETTTEEDEAKRPLWRRMLFLGTSKENAPTAESTAPASAPPPPPATEGTTAAEDKPGFFGRLLGADKKKPAEAPPAPETAKEQEKPVAVSAPEKPAPAPDKPKAKEKDQPASPPKTEPAQTQPEPKPTEEGKPSKLNPLNWFRGGKKPAEEKTEEAPPPAKTKGGQTSMSLPGDMNLARLLSPSLADAWQMLAPAAPRQTVDILNFLKGRPKEEAPKKEGDAPKSTAPAPAPAKAETKSPPRKRRATNPNSTPAARPKPAADGERRTTNPNAKPVPASAVPMTETTASPAITSGLVPVILPLEEYKLIMKRPDRGEILDRNLATLRALDLRVGTLFRPVVLAYVGLFTDLKEGKTKDADKRIAALRQFALIAYQKTVAVRDYLDFYEANESTGLSGKFDDYLNLPAIIQKELPPREDPISKYLDAIDKEFSE